jgi:D-3-phosphoglycerate dehydrogenase / 2-oxoglutarate reductase
MKVLIADKFPEKYVSDIQKLGLEVIYKPKLGADDLLAEAKDVSILIVRSTEVIADCIDNSEELSLIIRAGAGVNNIDLKAASAKGIYVANCPGKNSVAVAELAMGLLLAIDRRIPDNVIDFKNGVWNKGVYSKADGIMGKTLGIIGVGKIGIEMIHRAGAFGMEICAWSRSLTPDKAAGLGISFCESIEELVIRSDVISIHLALKPDTKGLISKSVIDLMKPGTILINTSRAEVLDQAALAEAIQSGKLRGGIDVLMEEPEEKKATFSSGLQELKDLYVTHHIGASTEQAQNAVAEETVTIIREYMQQGKVKNWVNRCKITEAEWQLVVRHYDKPGVLANVMNVLKKGNINAEELENVIFDGKIAACCTIQLDNKPSDPMLEEIRSRKDEVISATLINLNGKSS